MHDTRPTGISILLVGWMLKLQTLWTRAYCIASSPSPNWDPAASVVGRKVIYRLVVKSSVKRSDYIVNSSQKSTHPELKCLRMIADNSYSLFNTYSTSFDIYIYIYLPKDLLFALLRKTLGFHVSHPTFSMSPFSALTLGVVAVFLTIVKTLFTQWRRDNKLPAGIEMPISFFVAI